MRLTSFTDYGLRMLMRLASTPSEGISTAAMAAEFGLSGHHLSKIMQHLARAGIVETRRGRGGGAMLARPAAELTLGFLVSVLEQDQPIVECFAGGDIACTLNGRCGLKSRLRQAERAFLAELDRTTLADIALPRPIVPR